MNYSQLISYLKKLTNQGVNPSLKEITLLCRELGNPQAAYRSIQVTGTNGKTSTAKMLASILKAHGLRCGLYLSPHLIKYNERLSINGRLISDQEFVELAEKVMGAVVRVNELISPRQLSEFEVLTGMAFYYFAEKQVDVAIFEVGMGGRWDATSAIIPKVAVVTKIAKDHAGYLGETLTEITSEKSYVIKDQTSAVSGPQADEVRDVLLKRAQAMSGSVTFLGRDFDILPDRESGDISVTGLYKKYHHLKLGLGGSFQEDNAALAIAAAETYLQAALDNSKLSQALLEVESMGRWQRIGQAPAVIFDGAHNPAGISRLTEEIEKQSFKKLILIISVLRDKEAAKMLEILLPLADIVFVTTNTNQRAMPVKELKELSVLINSKLLGDKQSIIEEASSVKDALVKAKAAANSDDLILLTGSLYGVGEGLAAASSSLLSKGE